MNRYEGIFIIKPNLSDEEAKGIVEKLSREITGGGGSIEESVPMGKRRLAYPIKRNDEGIYHRFNFTASSKHLENLKKYLNLNQEFIRHLILKTG